MKRIVSLLVPLLLLFAAPLAAQLIPVQPQTESQFVPISEISTLSMTVASVAVPKLFYDNPNPAAPDVALLETNVIACAAAVTPIWIHNHPQLVCYPDASWWPTVSAQAHWPVNGDIAHMHVDMSCPLYGEIQQGVDVSCLFSVLLHHYPGHVSQAMVGWTGLNDGYAHSLRWDDTSSETMPTMIGDPTGDRIWTGSLTVGQNVPITGWQAIQLDVRGVLDNGDQFGTRQTECLWLNTPGVAENGQRTPFVESHATFFQAAHPKRNWGDTQVGLMTYIPLTPISVTWPIEAQGIQYRDNGAFPLGPFHGTLEQRMDLDLHHGILGKTLYGPVVDPIGVTLKFDPDGSTSKHKYAVFWNAPIEEQLASSLIVVTVNFDPNAPPVTPPTVFLPPTPPPPPPPPTPVQTLQAVQGVFQLFTDSVAQGRYFVCPSTLITVAACRELAIK